MTTNSKKITRATFKSFIRKNIANLWTIEFSTFNGMIDCVDKGMQELHKATSFDFDKQNTLGLPDIWLCGDDRFHTIEYKGMHGIGFYNCCGSGAILTK